MASAPSQKVQILAADYASAGDPAPDHLKQEGDSAVRLRASDWTTENSAAAHTRIPAHLQMAAAALQIGDCCQTAAAAVLQIGGCCQTAAAAVLQIGDCCQTAVAAVLQIGDCCQTAAAASLQTRGCCPTAAAADRPTGHCCTAAACYHRTARGW